MYFSAGRGVCAITTNCGLRPLALLAVIITRKLAPPGIPRITNKGRPANTHRNKHEKGHAIRRRQHRSLANGVMTISAAIRNQRRKGKR